MTNLEKLLSAPIKKITKEAVEQEKLSDLNSTIKSGEEKKQRVMRYIKNNTPDFPAISEIVNKFDLTHDVIKDYGNGIVRAGFFADESYRVLCFDIAMPYAELRQL